jgi:hypothetical protein
MKRDNEQKSVDELLSQAIGAEPVRFDAEQWKQKYPQEVQLLAARTEVLKPESIARTNLWRIIMKNRITKLAAAVVLMIAGVTGFIAFVYNGAQPAYAVEQTIEALRQVTIVHMYGELFKGGKFEWWMKINPETDKPESMSMFSSDSNVHKVCTPDLVFYCDTLQNIVMIDREDSTLEHIGIRFNHFFEDTVEEAKKSGEIEIQTQAGDYIIMIKEYDGKRLYQYKVNGRSKLPVSMICLRNDDQGESVKSLDKINYNEELPVGIFEIPKNARVIEKNYKLDDPEKGLVIEGVSEEEACAQIAEEISQAIIDHNWLVIKKLFPLAELFTNEELETKVSGDNEITELLSVGKAQQMDNIWKIGCIYKKGNNETREIVWLIKFREINGSQSCVIAGQT